MQKTFRVLARLIAAGVVAQAVLIAAAHFWAIGQVQDGRQLDSSSLTDNAGDGLHWLLGQIVIPLLAIALVLAGALIRQRRALVWASVVLGLVIVQIALAYVAGAVPWLGFLHGLNAFVLLGVVLRIPAPDREPATVVRQ